MNVVSGSKGIIAYWISTRIRDMDGPPLDTTMYEALGFTRGERIVGGVIFSAYRKLRDGTGDITLTGAGETGWLTRQSLRVIFSYPFRQLNCSRVTAAAAKSNHRSRDMLERLGFKHEGTLKGGIARGRDAVLYGMTIEQCIWIR